MKNELRIGNYINNYNKVIGIGEYILCEALSFSGMIFIEDPKPIPLTEEILLKCGYATCSFRDNHFVIKGHTIWKCKDLFMCDKNGMVLKYLHQLQNLYFALTNEELTVNL